jgi:hypothetical protein
MRLAPLQDADDLDKVDDLRNPWLETKCPFCTPAEINSMLKARETIRKEIVQLSNIVQAIQQNGAIDGPLKGRVNNIRLDQVKAEELKRLVHESTFKPVTATGIHTISVAQFTITLRLFLMELRDSQTKNWEDIKSLMNEVNSGRISVPKDISTEINAVNNEINAREMTIILIKKLQKELPSNGCTKSMLNSQISFHEMKIDDLSDIIEGCKKEEELNGSLRADLYSLMMTARLVGGMRQSIIGVTSKDAYDADSNDQKTLPYGLQDVKTLHELRTSLTLLQTKSKNEQAQLSLEYCEKEFLTVGLFLEILDTMA